MQTTKFLVLNDNVDNLILGKCIKFANSIFKPKSYRYTNRVLNIQATENLYFLICWPSTEQFSLFNNLYLWALLLNFAFPLFPFYFKIISFSILWCCCSRCNAKNYNLCVDVFVFYIPDYVMFFLALFRISFNSLEFNTIQRKNSLTLFLL